MSARVCEREGCKVEVTGRSTRCPEHQAEHRRKAESARKRQARNADKCGQAASAFAPVSPDNADREAVAGEALDRAGLPKDLIERIKSDPGAPFEYAAALATMRREALADWARVKAALKAAGVTLADLERAMGAGDANGDGKQGRPVEWHDPEPWPEPVDGVALLSGIASFIQRYVSIAPALADTVALWIVVTWIHDRLEISPFLNVTSATKRCGKSLLLEVLGELVHHPLPVGGRVTSSALFRTIEMHAPAMLLDEADTFFGDDDELRGVVNGSQRRNSAYVMRCVGDDHEPRRFVTWCPKAIAGIGGLPDTVLDRSIVVRLARRPAGVSLAHWRDRDRSAIESLRRQLARWREDEAANIVTGLSGVTFPPGLHDRGRDAWEALLAIGDTAGSDWSGSEGRAWQAYEHVTASTADEETGAREMLLADLRAIFEARGWPEAIGTNRVLDDLIAIEGRPWSEWKRGKALTARGLSSLLKPFDVKPRNHLFPDGRQLKAYFLTDLEAHWKAYFPEAGDSYPSIRPSALKQGISCDPYPSTGDQGWTDTDRTNPLETREVDGWTDTNRGAGREAAPEPLTDRPALPSQPPGTPTAGEKYKKARDGE